ncbi:468_t:CDS:2, partial [Cetraspora pellucida]
AVKSISCEPQDRGELEGTLIIADFPNLQSINFYEQLIPSLTVINCPQLEQITLFQTYTEQIKVENCPQVKNLALVSNKLSTIDDTLHQLPNLRVLSVNNNRLTGLDISHNQKLISLSCDEGVQPIKELIDQIQTKERELASVREREQQQKTSELELEIQQLQELKSRLESGWQEREGELNEELGQLKQEKESLETQLQESETSLTNARQQLDSLKSEHQKQTQIIDLLGNLLSLLDENKYELNLSQAPSLKQKILDLDLAEQLTNKEQELAEQEVHQQSLTKLQQELQAQIMALAISSGLLSQQVEQLNNQL